MEISEELADDLLMACCDAWAVFRVSGDHSELRGQLDKVIKKLQGVIHGDTR